ncbi:MAG: STT3 domain-containing protein [Candidatus Omnitrophica bacterium]|nr:STT3 domain-containing protein [Candidatus Omnitrophota bacterium]
MKRIICFHIFLILLGFALFVRSFPAYFPQFKKQAAFDVEFKQRQIVRKQVADRYPDYNAAIKDKIISKIVSQDQKDKVFFNAQIEKEYDSLKAKYQDEKGLSYFLEVDPYCRLRHTRLILENGYPGNKKDDKNIYDTFMLAPKGEPVQPHRFLYYFSAYFYKLVTIFSPGLSLDTFLFYFPLFLLAVFLIAFYFFCVTFFSEVTAVLAVFFVSTPTVFILRSSAGWFDTDILNLLLPLTVIWCLGLAVRADRLAKSTLFAALAGFFLSIFAYHWVGWWFIMLVSFGFFVFAISNLISLHYKDRAELLRKIRPYLFSLLVFLLSSLGFCLWIAGFEPFSFAYSSLQQNFGLGKSMTPSIWPLVEYTVSELKQGNPLNVVIHLGFDLPMVVLALFSTLFVFIKEKRTHRSDVVVLLLCWLFFMAFAFLKGVRFSLFLIVPLAVFLAYTIESVGQVLIDRFKHKISPKLTAVISLIFLLVVFRMIFPVAKNSIQNSYSLIPMMNDTLAGVMNEIREKTPSNSIINSWWDYGNWFKEIARRRTIVDPQIQNRPITYWMARVIVSSDEEEAIRVLRMINNSSDLLFDRINKFFGDEFKTIAFLSRLIKEPYSAAKKTVVEYSLPPEIARDILDNLFIKEPAPAYFVVDKKMIGFMSNISFLGNWNFPKVYVIKHLNQPKDTVLNYLKDVFGLSFADAESLYNEVIFSTTKREESEVLSKRVFFVLPLSDGEVSEQTIYFDNSVVFDLNKIEARKYFEAGSLWRKFGFVYFYDGNTVSFSKSKQEEPKEKQVNLQNAEIPLKSGVLIIKEKDAFKCVGLSDEQLANSIFSRMFFLNGKTLKYFVPVIGDQETGTIVFKIEWPKSEDL